MPKRFYLTTPLYYVNAPAHIGHAYTTVVADALARWRRLHGEEVFLLTGTDEHGEKIAQAAQREGISPQAFVEGNSESFKKLWQKFGISYDHFIRTTDATHTAIVQKVLERIRPQLKLAAYTFWYCVPCETNFGLREVEKAKPLCPQCQRPVQQVEEEDYFLPLEAHRKWLQDYIQGHEEFIQPVARRNEALAMLEDALPDLCVTRPKERVPWGIEVPFSPSHTTYVWFDALLNYISALGWPDGKEFEELWNEAGAVHLIGKDILRHHAVYWPIILHAIGVQAPKTIFAHGWWLIKGEKMSKSKGNIVDPEAVVAEFGLDPFRYFLLRDVPFGEDGIFSEEAIVKRFNADLANDLGNLVYRTLTMLEKHAQGGIPSGKLLPELQGQFQGTHDLMLQAMNRMAPSEALRALWDLIGRANRLVEEKAPWELARAGKRQELADFLYTMAEMLRAAALLIGSFLPTSAEAVWRQLGEETPLAEQRLPSALDQPIRAGQRILKEKPLFPRLE